MSTTEAAAAAAQQDSEGDEPYQTCRWLFTWNNYPAWCKDKQQVRDRWGTFCQAVVLGFEKAPSTGTLHIQGYLQLQKKTTFKGLKKLLIARLENGHQVSFRKARGTTLENLNYCKKDGDYIEFGQWPNDAKEEPKRVRTAATDWDAIWDSAKRGKLDDIPAVARIRHYKTLKEVGADHAEKPEDLADLPGLWIYGRAGYGKSWKARHDYGGPVYTKDFSKWWNGYDKQPVVILDDVSPAHARDLADNLKIWGDKYPFNAETKGGFTGWIRPSTFIVTSQYRPAEVFRDQRTLDAIQRRFRLVELSQPWWKSQPSGQPDSVVSDMRDLVPVGGNSSSAGDPVSIQYPGPADAHDDLEFFLDIEGINKLCEDVEKWKDPFEGYGM